MKNAVGSNSVVKILDWGEWRSFSALCRYHLSQLYGRNHFSKETRFALAQLCVTEHIEQLAKAPRTPGVQTAQGFCNLITSYL